MRPSRDNINRVARALAKAEGLGFPRRPQFFRRCKDGTDGTYPSLGAHGRSGDQGDACAEGQVPMSQTMMDAVCPRCGGPMVIVGNRGWCLQPYSLGGGNFRRPTTRGVDTARRHGP